jgi:hypothetical protein
MAHFPAVETSRKRTRRHLLISAKGKLDSYKTFQELSPAAVLFRMRYNRGLYQYGYSSRIQ